MTTDKERAKRKRFVIAPTIDPHKLVPREWIHRGRVLLMEELGRLLEPFPARVAPLIVAEPDPTKRRAILDREVRRVLREFNAAKKSLVDKLYSTEH